MNQNAFSFNLESRIHFLKSISYGLIAAILAVVAFIPVDAFTDANMVGSLIRLYKEFTIGWYFELAVCLMTASLSVIHLKQAINSNERHNISIAINS